ncbi:MAG: hypothetical protein ACE5IQ_11725 [Candidatus Methylomirabilales bacterium]
MSLVAKAPTCPTCGGILMGYRRDEKLNFPVHFCPACEAKQAATAKVEVPEKAA